MELEVCNLFMPQLKVAMKIQSGLNYKSRIIINNYSHNIMITIKGPAVFLAQFAGDNTPFNTLEGMCKWASELGYKGIQIPSWDTRLIDVSKAAQSKTYCDEIKGLVNS